LEADFVGAVIDFLEAEGPALAARKVVSFLARTYRSATAAAFVENRGALELLTCNHADQPAINTVQATWRVNHTRIRAGELFATPSSVLVPLSDAGVFVGVLFLRSDAPTLGRIDLVPMGPLLDLLAQVARQRDAAVAPDWASALRTTAPEDLEREQLRHQLDESEWNVARVARARGVTRPTIYHWMERLGIERRHVRSVTGFARKKA